MENLFDEYLPPWAIKKSDGTYMEAGAQLATRDGRRMGNAYVDHLWGHAKLGQLAYVVTDIGNTFNATAKELEELFYPPTYVMDVAEARETRTMKGN
jgi:hypothetical protein